VRRTRSSCSTVGSRLLRRASPSLPAGTRHQLSQMPPRRGREEPCARLGRGVSAGASAAGAPATGEEEKAARPGGSLLQTVKPGAETKAGDHAGCREIHSDGSEVALSPRGFPQIGCPPGRCGATAAAVSGLSVRCRRQDSNLRHADYLGFAWLPHHEGGAPSAVSSAAVAPHPRRLKHRGRFFAPMADPEPRVELGR
jgi:hypothetical protein